MTNQTTDDLLAAVATVMQWSTPSGKIQWSVRAVGGNTFHVGSTARDAMLAALAESKMPFNPQTRVKPDDSLKVTVDKVVRVADSVEQEPNADLF